MPSGIQEEVEIHLYVEGEKVSSTQNTERFVAGLFDFNFNQFVTLKFAKFIYVLAFAFWAAVAVVLLIGGVVSRDGLYILIGAVGGPLLFFVGLTLSRLYLEVIVVLFRIADNTKQMASRTF